MQHVVGNAGEASETGRPIEVGNDRRRTQRAERIALLRPPDESTNQEAAGQPRNDPAGHVTASDNQHLLHFSTFH